VAPVPVYGLVAHPAQVAAMAAQLRVQYRLKLPDAVQLASASALDIGAVALVTHVRDFSEVLDFPVLTGVTA
jgi:hypothetical protein